MAANPRTVALGVTQNLRNNARAAGQRISDNAPTTLQAALASGTVTHEDLVAYGEAFAQLVAERGGHGETVLAMQMGVEGLSEVTGADIHAIQAAIEQLVASEARTAPAGADLSTPAWEPVNLGFDHLLSRHPIFQEYHLGEDRPGHMRVAMTPQAVAAYLSVPEVRADPSGFLSFLLQTPSFGIGLDRTEAHSLARQVGALPSADATPPEALVQICTHFGLDPTAVRDAYSHVFDRPFVTRAAVGSATREAAPAAKQDGYQVILGREQGIYRLFADRLNGTNAEPRFENLDELRMAAEPYGVRFAPESPSLSVPDVMTGLSRLFEAKSYLSDLGMHGDNQTARTLIEQLLFAAANGRRDVVNQVRVLVEEIVGDINTAQGNTFVDVNDFIKMIRVGAASIEVERRGAEVGQEYGKSGRRPQPPPPGAPVTRGLGGVTRGLGGVGGFEGATRGMGGVTRGLGGVGGFDGATRGMGGVTRGLGGVGGFDGATRGLGGIFGEERAQTPPLWVQLRVDEQLTAAESAPTADHAILGMVDLFNMASGQVDPHELHALARFARLSDRGQFADDEAGISVEAQRAVALDYLQRSLAEPGMLSGSSIESNFFDRDTQVLARRLADAMTSNAPLDSLISELQAKRDAVDSALG